MTTVAEIEVIAELDTRQIVAGMDTIKRKTTELGQHHDYTLSSMRRGWHDLRRTWFDVISAVGLVSGAVGIAMVAVNALSSAFANTAKTAKESVDEIKNSVEDLTRQIENIQGRGKSFEQEAAIIGAKYAPGSKEYKEAMLSLQERQAAEAYTKFGSPEALGEITGIQAQRKKLALSELPLQQQWEMARYGGYQPGADTYNYGLSPAYQKAAEGGIWAATSGKMNLQALGQTFGTDWWSGEALKKTGIPGTPGMGTAAPERRLPELEEIKKHLDTLAKEPRTVNITIETLNSIDAPLTVASKIGEAAAMGYNTSNIKAR